MHLKDDHRTCRNFLRSAGRKNVYPFARRITRKEQSERVAAFARAGTFESRTAIWRAAAVINHRRVGPYLQQRPILIEDIALHQRSRAALALLELLDHLGSLDERDHVMNDFAVAGKNLGRADPLVLFEVCWDDEVLNRVWSSRIDGEFLPEVEHSVWLAQPPAASRSKLRHGRKILRIAFLRALIDPCYDRVDVLLREPMIVSVLAVFRIRAPGRHLASEDFFLDRSRPRTSFFVSHQRHRSDVDLSVTLGAVLVKDRRNVSVESNLFAGASVRARRREHDET